MAEQDDWYYPYRLEKQYKYMEENPEVGLLSGIAEFYNVVEMNFKMPDLLVHGKQYPQDPVEMFKLNYRNGPKLNQTCMMVRKSVHINNGLYFSQHYHTAPIDWIYLLRFSLISPIRGLHVPLVVKDRRPSRTSVTSNKVSLYKVSRELLRSMYWEHSIYSFKK